MTTSIFIRSYRGDKEWLSYCLRSLESHAKGFEQIVVAIPNHDMAAFNDFDFRGAAKVPVNTPDALKPDGKKNDYVGQQVTKLEADLHCSADFILFIDSDCVAHRDFTADEFFVNAGKFAKPRQLIRHWAGMTDGSKWREVIKQHVGFESPFEHMATMPLIYDRNTLRLFRDFMAETHKKVLWEYIKNPGTHNISEFNCLGAFALRFTPQLYDWKIADPATDEYPRPVHQHWSWGGIKPDMPAKFEAWISGAPVPKKHRLLLGIHSYTGANPLVELLWPWYLKAEADEIIGFGTEDGGCRWPQPIRNLNIGENRYMDGKSDHLCRRLLDTIEACLPLEWDHLCLTEYDGIFFHPMPRDLPEGICATYSGGPGPGRKGNSFYHCPWVFSRSIAPKVIEFGRQMIRDGDIELGSPDCFIGRMAERFNLPITNVPFKTYSRNSLDIPWQLEEAATAVQDGATFIHGVKNAEQLGRLLK